MARPFELRERIEHLEGELDQVHDELYKEPLGIIHRVRDLERLARIQLWLASVVTAAAAGLVVERVLDLIEKG